MNCIVFDPINLIYSFCDEVKEVFLLISMARAHHFIVDHIDQALLIDLANNFSDVVTTICSQFFS